MTARDRQRLKILSILLIVLAMTLWVGGQIRQTPTVLAIETAEAREAQTDRSDVLSRAQLASSRLVMLPDQDRELGRRNLFEYGSEPVAQLPTVLPDELDQTPPAAAAAPAMTSSPPPPPPPPPIPFKYSGYAIVDLDSGRMQAFLFDDDRSFSVFEEEVLMGRYRINEVTLTFVEVEDLEFGRRQRLPLIVE